MTAMLATVLVGFLAGYLWGKAEKVVLAFIFDREETPMRFLRRIVGHQTTVSTWTVVVSLVISLLVSGWVVTIKREDKARTECSIAFNRLSAQARDDRIAAQSAALQAQIDTVRSDIHYQGELRQLVLAKTQATKADVVAIFDRRISANNRLLKTLTHQQAVAAAHAYPPPDFCEGR